MTITLDRGLNRPYREIIEVPYDAWLELLRGNEVMVDGEVLGPEDGPFSPIFNPPESKAVQRGGPGSGHHGHRGRPGKVGGSLPSGQAAKPQDDRSASRPANFGDKFKTSHGDILNMTPQELDSAIQFQKDRAEALGLEVYTDAESRILRQFELNLEKMTEKERQEIEAAGEMQHQREWYRKAWLMMNKSAARDPDPRYVLACLRDLNDAAEQGWMPIPPVPIFISRGDLAENDSAQATYKVGGPDGLLSGSYIAVWQQDEPGGVHLEKWLSRQDRQISFSELSAPVRPVIEVTSQFYPNHIGAAVVHEMGHHWDFHSAGDALKARNPNTPYDRAKELLDDGAGSQRVYSDISDYAAVRPAEAVAEAWSLRHHLFYEIAPADTRALVEWILYGTGPRP